MSNLIYLPLSFTLATTVGWLRCSSWLTLILVLADLRWLTLVCVILLVFHSCRDVVTTIVLTARDKKLKIELKVQRAKVSPNRCVKPIKRRPWGIHSGSPRRPENASVPVQWLQWLHVDSPVKQGQTKKIHGFCQVAFGASARLDLRPETAKCCAPKCSQAHTWQSSWCRAKPHFKWPQNSRMAQQVEGGHGQPLVLLDHSRRSWSSF